MLETNLKPSEVWPQDSEISVLGWRLGVCVLKELESDGHWTALGWGREELAEGEKKGISIYRAHPKAPELLTPSLTASLLGTSYKGKDWRARVWVQGSGPGLNRRPRHLACGARAIGLSPLFPRVLQGSGIVLSVPSETFHFVSPQSANFRGSGVARGAHTRRDRPRGLRDF